MSVCGLARFLSHVGLGHAGPQPSPSLPPGVRSSRGLWAASGAAGIAGPERPNVLVWIHSLGLLPRPACLLILCNTRDGVRRASGLGLWRGEVDRSGPVPELGSPGERLLGLRGWGTPRAPEPQGFSSQGTTVSRGPGGRAARGEQALAPGHCTLQAAGHPEAMSTTQGRGPGAHSTDVEAARSSRSV